MCSIWWDGWFFFSFLFSFFCLVVQTQITSMLIDFLNSFHTGFCILNYFFFSFLFLRVVWCWPRELLTCGKTESRHTLHTWVCIILYTARWEVSYVNPFKERKGKTNDIHGSIRAWMDALQRSRSPSLQISRALNRLNYLGNVIPNQIQQTKKR